MTTTIKSSLKLTTLGLTEEPLDVVEVNIGGKKEVAIVVDACEDIAAQVAKGSKLLCTIDDIRITLRS